MNNQIVQGNCLEVLRDMPDELVDCVVTSPPYWGLRAYEANPVVWGEDKDCKHKWETEIGKTIQYQICLHCSAWRGQLGLEPTIELYISHLVEIFAECKRILKKTGTMWINIGDSYAGTGNKGEYLDPKYPNGRTGQAVAINNKVEGVQSKSLCQIPERLSIALTDQLGLIKRNTIIWWKRNCMPSSASDRFTVDFEPIYFFTKHQNYWFEQQLEDSYWAAYDKRSLVPGGVKHKLGKSTSGNYAFNGTGYTEGGMRNKRTVWDIPTEPSSDAHFAVFPRSLVYTPIAAGCPPGGVVLDPFAGTGTTCLEAKEQGKNYIGIELSPQYVEIANNKLRQEVLPLYTTPGAGLQGA